MDKKIFIPVVLLIIAVILLGGLGYLVFANKGNLFSGPEATPTTTPTPTSSLPTTCLDQEEGTPVITALSSYSGPVGSRVEIKGCNFAGFEGDLNAWIENSEGKKGILYGKEGSTSKVIKVILESPLCQEDTSYSGLPCSSQLILTPGEYKIYTLPWGKKSNEAHFTIQ